MTHYDPLERGPQASTVDDYEPTPVEYGSLRAVRGTVYFGSTSGRHRVRAKRRDAYLYAIYAWSMLMIALGSAFIVSLMLDVDAPEWLELTLASVPGTCLVTVGVFAMINTRRCECGGTDE